MDVTDFMQTLYQTLSSATPFPLHNEKALQTAVHDCLILSGFEAYREVNVSSSDRIDHMVRGQGVPKDRFVGIECKIAGATRSLIARQVTRYSEADSVLGIILITQRTISPPPLHENKPFLQIRPSGVGGIA